MDYANISKAVDFYQDRGYVYIDDAPWVVGQDAYYATKPKGARDVQLNICTTETLSFPSKPSAASAGRIYPVASGEQSFLQMMMDGQPLKRAICVTPCHRAEPRIDTLHRPYFMKAELINAQDVDEGHLIHMVHDACTFFEQYFPVRVLKTDAGYDIVEKGSRFELGSYGLRRHWKIVDGKESVRFDWIYGTACAEPRLSTAVQKALKHTGK